MIPTNICWYHGLTHVLVNDPTRGYGILAENMVSQCVWEEQAQVS